MAHKVTIHRINGETAEMWAVDANEAVHKHPNEWSHTPFSAEQLAAAQADTSIEPRVVPSEGSGPFI